MRSSLRDIPKGVSRYTDLLVGVGEYQLLPRSQSHQFERRPLQIQARHLDEIVCKHWNPQIVAQQT